MIDSVAIEQTPGKVPGKKAGLVLTLGAFVMVSIVSFVLIAPAMRLLGPLLMTSDMGGAEHVLRPSANTYFFTAVPVAIALGFGGALLYGRQLSQYRRSIPAVCAVAALVAFSVAPFFLVVQSRVEFAPEALRINPVFGWGTTSYPYSEIASIRASLSGPAGGWMPGPDQFIFAIKFNDGRSWNSTWYPYESDPIQNSILIRYLSKKSGKPATPAPLL